MPTVISVREHLPRTATAVQGDDMQRGSLIRKSRKRGTRPRIRSHLVREGAKRKKVPCVLTPAEIEMLVDGFGLRERTFVLLAASTGLRQSELFDLKWGDINLEEGTMNVTRSMVSGVVGPCKTASSQRPVPVHPLIVDTLAKWRAERPYRKPDDWVFAIGRRRPQAILGKQIHRRALRDRRPAQPGKIARY